jgi:hypothetical protein
MKYPFSPAVLDALPESIAELFRGLEDRLLQEICWRLVVSGDLNQVTVEDIRELRAHGITLDEITTAIAETTQTSLDKVDAIMDGVVERNRKYYGTLATAAEITAPRHIVDDVDVEAIRRQTKDELRNLTQSMGFAVRRNGKVVKWLEPKKAYQWALDMAETEVMSGTISYNGAIAHATKQLAAGGLTSIHYESNGRVHYDQADVAARRAVMTGVNQTCQRYAEQSMERLETNLVEVSAHGGARNTGNGPENHAAWQGRVYAWNKPGQPKDTRHPDFEEVTGYGTGPGLGGWNCRHHYYPYIDGVSSRTYTDKQLREIDQPPFEYQGRTYDQYQASQKQREIERSIRKQKRIQKAAEALGTEEAAKDATAARAKIRLLNREYRLFSEAANLPLQRERTKVVY